MKTDIPSTPQDGITANFTNNGFIALQGLNAPSDINDSYTWARDKYYASFLALHELKRQGKFLAALPPADIKLNIHPDFEEAKKSPFSFSDFNSDDIAFACGSLQEKNKIGSTPCLTREKIDELKKTYATEWKRFEQLPSYNTCTYIPKAHMSSLMNPQTFIDLTRLKSTDLFYKALDGKTDAAINEWAGYMNFFRKCLSGNQDDIVLSALYAINFNIILYSLNDILLEKPKSVTAHQHLINMALQPLDETILVTPYLVTNDYLSMASAIMAAQSSIEKSEHNIYESLPKLFGLAYPSNGFLKDLQNCANKQKAFLQQPISQYVDRQYLIYCNKEFPKDISSSDFWTKVATTSGNPISNLINYFLVSGVLRSDDLAKNMRHTQGLMIMSRLGIDLAQREIPTEQLQSEINLAPPSLYDPFTNKPFRYDNDQHALYMNAPGGEGGKDRETYFYLPKP